MNGTTTKSNERQQSTHHVCAQAPNVNFFIQRVVTVFFRGSPLSQKGEISNLQRQFVAVILSRTYITVTVPIQIFAVFSVFLIIERKLTAVKVTQLEISIRLYHILH